MWRLTAGFIGLGLAIVLIAGAVPINSVHASAPPGTSCAVFPADNVWNTDISALPVHSRSAAWLSSTGATSGTLLHPDFGGPPYGIPFNVVDSTHATANFNFLYWRESDPTVATQQPQGPYPYGTDLQIEAPTDSHLLTINKDTCKLYEIGGTNYNGAHTGWSGAIFDLNSNRLRPDTWTSADAAGLPIFPGLVRLDEVQAGSINHAIRFTVQQSDTSHLWPARHDAGTASDPNLAPMGARFRMKSTFDISGFSPQAQVVLTAMKHYGLIVADNGSNWFFQGTMDSGWNVEPYATMVSQLKTVPASAFEAVDESSLMVDPNSAQAVPPLPCTAVGAVASPASPQPIGTLVTITGSATGCPNPRYQFWLLAPGSTTWTLAKAYSASAAFNWDTSGATAGLYHFSVWARDASSAGTNNAPGFGTYDTFQNITYPFPSNSCTGVGVSVAPASSQLSGTPVTITGTVTGCPSPRYEFWLLAPGSSTWTLAQTYNASAAFNWNTTGGAAGVYNISVWARDASSAGTTSIAAGTYDTFHNITFTLQTIPCAAVGVTPSPTSPQLSGAPVMITGSATGCPSPNYEFWILAPGSSTWTLVQPYGSSAVFNWNSTGGAPVVYNISVWARDNSSTGTNNAPGFGTYDTFHNITYTLQTQPCTGLTILVSPSSPRASGTPITITGNATGCPSPRYEFWMLAPGSTTWTLVKAYSASAVFNWTTTGLTGGIYNFSVWARDNSSAGTNVISAGSYDTFHNIAYTLT